MKLTKRDKAVLDAFIEYCIREIIRLRVELGRAQIQMKGGRSHD